MVIETDADEANYGNNEKDVSVHAKCAISLSSGNGFGWRRLQAVPRVPGLHMAHQR